MPSVIGDTARYGGGWIVWIARGEDAWPLVLSILPVLCPRSPCRRKPEEGETPEELSCRGLSRCERSVRPNKDSRDRKLELS